MTSNTIALAAIFAIVALVTAFAAWATAIKVGPNQHMTTFIATTAIASTIAVILVKIEERF